MYDNPVCKAGFCVAIGGFVIAGWWLALALLLLVGAVALGIRVAFRRGVASADDHSGHDGGNHRHNHRHDNE
jgi:ABC-type transport system involved in cytochrome bd biosynthesis fused ATPase/permease subunit